MPDNTIEWGQGAVNNTNNWGKAKTNNTIDFGAIYDDSPSGDTDLGATSTPVGVVNTKSLAFDGINDYVNTGYTFSGDKWSYSYWVKISDPSNSNYFYHVTARNSGTEGLIIWSGNGSVSSQRNFTAKINSTPITFSVASFDVWYHIVITGDGSNLTAYVDGTQVATTAISTLFPTINYTTKIGSNKNGTNFFFKGNIDEVAIFDYELSSSAVSEIYNIRGSGRAADMNNLTNATTDPILWYRMGDGDTFSTITDNGTGGNNGTMTNMASDDIVNDTF